ncbi:MAG: efflux RND transporter periplasmic adaptor subunit [Deferribacteres bacterium]|nr:efflux RND transporter periplasmic adaptor subunit [candidate division KSB1 bacterium]MCB9501041.1 efflux RND transporter periplasmic adaptor subunit [Deferribacteres bacterium]
MIKKTIVFFSLIFAIACGGGDKQAELKKLEAQRDEINAKIEVLRNELADQNGDGAPAVITYVDIVQVQPELFRHFIKVQGNVISDNNIMVPAQASGLVKRIYVKEGENVKKGQLLAEIDGAIYERNLAELKTNLELARTLFERQERLWKQKIGSEVQYLQAKTNKESLENRLASVEEQYRLTKFIAPIDGTVDQINLKEGEATAAGMGGVRVVQLSKLKIEAKLSEKYIDDVRVGDEVQVELPVLGKTFTSKIRAVSQVIDPQNRTFPIEIDMPGQSKMIKPNMLTVLTINDYSNENAFTVPVRVLQHSGTDQFLFTAVEAENNDGFIAKKRSVEAGENDGTVAEIVSGLQAGDRVVTRGFQDLADGQKVMRSIAEANGQ